MYNRKSLSITERRAHDTLAVWNIIHIMHSLFHKVCGVFALITFTGGFEEWKTSTANTKAYIQLTGTRLEFLKCLAISCRQQIPAVQFTILLSCKNVQTVLALLD